MRFYVQAKRRDDQEVGMDEPSEHDLKKARELVEAHGPLVGTADSLHETVAQLVARAIAIGREEGLRIAAKPRRRRATGKDSSPPETH